MKRKKASYVISLVAIIAFILIGLIFNGASAFSPKKAVSQQEDTMPILRNYVSAFKVESFERVNDEFVLRLRNVSNKGISAYSYSLGPVNHPTNRDDADGLFGDIIIAPDAVKEIQIPTIALVHSAEVTPTHESIINIVAVIFEDHTVEGDQKVISTMTDVRLGEKIQLKRIHRLLKEVLNTTDDEIISKSGNLEARIAALSEAPEPGQSDAVKSGLHSAKELVLLHLRNHVFMSDAGINKREGLKQVADQTEQLLSRY